MGNCNPCCCCGSTNKIRDGTVQKPSRRSALHPHTWARKFWRRHTKVHPTDQVTEDPDSIVVEKLGQEKLTSPVGSETSTSDLVEETLETPGVSVAEDSSLATLSGTSGGSENDATDKSLVWAWLWRSIPDEEDLWITKVMSGTSDSEWVVESLEYSTNDEDAPGEAVTIRVTVHEEEYFGDCEDSGQVGHDLSSQKSHEDPV
ncbi:uncharacterized protein LOC113913058 isoform X2 [Zalophus californianus]|uniref:Uncharacterized protein LOC113913058 isoform X2 n=1 Tax=Zalophus californianus TaxID=9704 RepID=A0A6P9F2P8_ZALCA|nr:uncharacterized protein LOC113913058 isoform X2 [Zalophus californianus]